VLRSLEEQVGASKYEVLMLNVASVRQHIVLGSGRGC
jgi:hypothetical protein